MPRLALIAVLALAACARAQPKTFTEVPPNPSLRALSVGVIHSDKAKRTRAALEAVTAQDRRNDPRQIFGAIESVLRRNFAQVTSYESVEAALKAGSDLAMTLDVAFTEGSKTQDHVLSLAAAFIGKEKREVSSMKAEARYTQPWPPRPMIPELGRDLAQEFAEQLTLTPGLSAYAEKLKKP